MSDKVTKYNFPQSGSGGVKPLSIRGVYEEERYRLSEEFTDEERKWRKQWLKDQVLSPSEPKHVSELEKELKNPIRRFLSYPWKVLEAKMTPVFGSTVSTHFRHTMPKVIVFIIGTYFTWYHLKYNQNDWTHSTGWNVIIPKPVVFPGDENFPAKRVRFEPHDYDDRGFKDRKVFLD